MEPESRKNRESQQSSSKKMEINVKTTDQRNPKTEQCHRWIVPTTQRINTSFSKTIPKYRNGKNILKLILERQLHPDIKTRQRCCKKQKFMEMLLMDTGQKFSPQLCNTTKTLYTVC